MWMMPLNLVWACTVKKLLDYNFDADPCSFDPNRFWAIDVLPNLKDWDSYKSLAFRSGIVLSTRTGHRSVSYVLSFKG